MASLLSGSVLLPLLLTVGVLAAALVALLWQRRSRAYLSTASVAAAYDRWTDDRLLERLWGEHVHLGHYGNPPGACDFRAAKAAFVHELARWSGLDRLPPGSRVLDVGCGIGGSARILARDYGFEVLGISISPAQIARARELTPADLPGCRFAVMDALALALPDGSPGAGFDAVWSVEAGPHMPDKQRYADEMLRVLRPGGCLAVADWNRRDPAVAPMNRLERWVMRQLLDQWAHPEFASIPSLRRHLESSPWNRGLPISTADWTVPTLPSWVDSILEGVRRPGAVLGLGPQAVVQGLRETPTLLLMHWAFRTGLMQFGVFRGPLPVSDGARRPSP
jgi:MPBQ/MSBQ methyltransferase